LDKAEKGSLIMKRIAGLFLLLLVAGCLNPSAAYGRTYRVHFVAAHDVDTFRIDRMAFDDQMQIRLDGWNGPEIDGAQCPEERAFGEKGRDALNELGRRSSLVIVKNPKKDKFGGRWRTKKLTFTIAKEPVDPGAVLAAAGYLVPYQGGKRDPMFWCNRLAPPLPVDLLPPELKLESAEDRLD
jgi:endonuclease YncB( thermonuclease family)